ncbi:hypothetical protein KI387_000879, partial [Taxus chinensis]
MWNVFPDEIGLNNSFELALVNLDINESVQELVTFDDGIGDLSEGSSATPENEDLGLEGLEEEGDYGGSGGKLDHFDYDYE